MIWTAFHNDITSLEALSHNASLLATHLREKTFFVVALRGDLASGKTTFVKLVAEQLGVTAPVQSPTYTISRTYNLSDDRLLYHYDLYRLGTLEDIYDIGLMDQLSQKQGLFFIEWPKLLSPTLQQLCTSQEYCTLHLRQENNQRIFECM